MGDKIDLATVHLYAGDHSPGSGQACAMEIASMLAGEAWSDRPACVSPALGAYVRGLNDSLPDGPRQRLREYIPRTLNTAGDPAAEERRAWLASDWIVRVYTPAWLELAGLTEDAARLRALPEVMRENVDAAIVQVHAAGVEAAKARDAAWAAAGDAARDAARDAAGEKMRPTVDALQESAFELLDRMIEA